MVSCSKKELHCPHPRPQLHTGLFTPRELNQEKENRTEGEKHGKKHAFSQKSVSHKLKAIMIPTTGKFNFSFFLAQ